MKRERICLSLWFSHPSIHAQGIHDRAHDLAPLQVIWQPWLRGVERARRGSEAHGPKVPRSSPALSPSTELVHLTLGFPPSGPSDHASATDVIASAKRYVAPYLQLPSTRTLLSGLLSLLTFMSSSRSSSCCSYASAAAAPTYTAENGQRSSSSPSRSRCRRRPGSSSWRRRKTGRADGRREAAALLLDDTDVNLKKSRPRCGAAGSHPAARSSR